MREDIFFAVLTCWGIAWMMVLLSYGAATHRSWRDQDGRWVRIPGDLLGFCRWFLWNFWQDVRHGFRAYPEPPRSEYSQGHLLRFFITLGALVAGVLGFATALLDREPWHVILVGIVLVAVALSTIAALGHLSVAWQTRPRRWRLFVLVLAAWFFAAMQLRPVFEGILP